MPATSPERAPNGKRSARRRGGGKQKAKNRSATNNKRQQKPIAAAERVDTVDADKETHSVVGLRPQVSSEVKAEEILIWLRRARAKHCKDVINYERSTVRGSLFCEVESSGAWQAEVRLVFFPSSGKHPRASVEVACTGALFREADELLGSIFQQ